MPQDPENQYEALAVAGYKSSSGYVDDDYLPELRNDKGRRIIRQMTNDETVGSFLLALSSIYSSVTWNVDPSDMEDPRAEEYADWLEEALIKDMGDPRGPQPDDTWEAFVQTFADVDAFGWGYYDVWVKQRDDGSTGIARLMPVAPETLYEWEIQDDGHVTGLYQQSPRTFQINYIPSYRALHMVSQPYKNSPEGRSIFRTGYRMWYYKKVALEIEMILHERGAGFPVMYVHADTVKLSREKDGNGQPTERAKAATAAMKSYEDLVKNIKRNSQSGAVLYYDTIKDVDGESGSLKNTNIKTVELKLESPSNTSSSGDIDKTIRRLDASLARAMLADFLMFNTDGGSGNSGGLTSRVDLFLKVMTGLLENKVDTINRQVVPQLWELNGYPDEYMPRLRAGAIERESVHRVIETLERMARTGFAVGGDREVQEWAYGELGVPKTGIRNTDPLQDLED